MITSGHQDFYPLPDLAYCSPVITRSTLSCPIVIVAAVVEVLGIALVCVVQNQHCHNSRAITHLYKITQFPSTLAISASGLVISFELLVVLIWPVFFLVQLISFYCLLLRGRFKKIFCNFAVPRFADFIISSNQHASLVLPCPCPTHITPADVLSVKITYISFFL